MMIRFVTGNDHKRREAESYLGESVDQIDYEYPEIQSDDLHEIAVFGARDAYRSLGANEPVMVEDSGLFIDGLGGFPGPFSAYVESTLGIEAVWRLVDRECPTPYRARFVSVVGYALPDGDDPIVETFEGILRGRIVEPRGSRGFGYDPIFEYSGRTLAEMTMEEKNAISHRGRALTALADRLADGHG